ncbi:MAG: hypothetical protein GYB39_11310 [Algicola sp.]|nr:hypothetical protein [Algicola sp.]
MNKLYFYFLTTFLFFNSTVRNTQIEDVLDYTASDHNHFLFANKVLYYAQDNGFLKKPWLLHDLHYQMLPHVNTTLNLSLTQVQ